MNYPAWIILVTQLLVLGSLFAVLPSMRRGLLFGVTVPVDFASAGEGRRILRHYRRMIGILMLLCLFSGAAGILAGSTSASLWGWLAAFLGGVALWARAHRQTSRFRTQVSIIRSASLTGSKAAFPWMQALSILPLGFVALMLRVSWTRLPASFPQHWNAHGIANGWGHQSFASVYFPVLAGLAIYFFLLLLALAAPRIRQSIPYIARILSPISWLVMLVMTGVSAIPLAAAAGMSVKTMGLLVALLASAGGIGVVVIVVVATVRSRQTMAPYGDTADAGWRAGGIVYYNPADPALWVEKRFGIGMTLNFARLQSWLILGAIFAFIGVLVTFAAVK